MKKISLTQGQFAIVDDEDYGQLVQIKWCAAFCPCTRSFVAKRAGEYMHRRIMKADKGWVVDHISHDSLDNRKENLRICTSQQNSWNRKTPLSNSTGFKGTTWNKKAKRFQAQIMKDGKNFNLGLYLTVRKAHEAYKIAAKNLFGNFSRMG